MENIKPAVPSNEKSLKELSPQEFQEVLSSWFEERGIVQNMKSYIKFQMINVLKSTVIGKNIRCVPQTYSLAQQAIHLIVAEYLIQNKCYFTLSQFSNEVNLTNILPSILPQDKLFFCNDNSREALNIFDKDNLMNVLELIGIPKDNEHFSKIVKQYFDNQKSSLLSCLIALIEKNSNDQNSNDQESKDIYLEDNFMGNIRQVLQSLNLSQKMQNKLLHNIKLCYDLKTKSFEDQCIQLINKFKKELSVRDKRNREVEKQKKSLEKRVLKLQEENETMKKKIKSLLEENRVVYNGEKTISVCSLNHCDEKCHAAERLHETYKRENEILKVENSNHKEEIQRLRFNCNELLKEFNCCQSKINLVNTRIQEANTCEGAFLLTPGHIDKNTENSSSDSDTTITEEILQQAREKLKLLEEESKELDIRFSRFFVK